MPMSPFPEPDDVVRRTQPAAGLADRRPSDGRSGGRAGSRRSRNQPDQAVAETSEGQDGADKIPSDRHDPAVRIVAGWRDRAVERSLRESRARAVSRSEQFLQAAIELLTDTGRTDFTIQDLTERAQLSLRSFYQHFSGKDELLLAVFEEAIRTYVAMVRSKIDQEPDPVERLRRYVHDLCSTVGSFGPSGRLLSQALSIYHLRLAAEHPELVAQALEPQVQLAADIIEVGAVSGRFRDDVAPRQLALLLTQTLVAVGHMQVLGTHVTGVRIGVDELWSFCLGGVSRSAGC